MMHATPRVVIEELLVETPLQVVAQPCAWKKVSLRYHVVKNTAGRTKRVPCTLFILFADRVFIDGLRSGGLCRL